MDAIRCLCLDVDGVLTDGRIYIGADGEPMRAFHVQDGLAIYQFQRLGGVVVIITGKSSRAVQHRAAELGVKHLIQGSTNKRADLEALLPKLNVTMAEVAAIGDDLLDLPVLEACGYPMAVANAAEEVKTVARFVTTRAGGTGAVREAIEHVLRETDQWQKVVDHYRAPTAEPTP